ncbi:MAG: glycoside hydrolase family 20 zincin-like fold domain-containing protein, partial [Planctomycetota bacterium]|nr:glycoside hydrolase family 20 zincin-like fold domain-containing protein [Planctomycetota bacterium]
WWTWEAKIEFKYLWTRGFDPPDPKKIQTWKVGFNRWSNFHGEIGWYGSMLSSLNHQTDHCPVFKLAGPGTAPKVQLTHPMLGEGPGRFSVSLRNLRTAEQTYRVKVLRRNEPFDPVLGEVSPLNAQGEEAGTVELKPGQDAKLDYQVPFKGWRNQYRVEVWDGGKTPYFKSLWYSLGDDILSHGWDSKRPQLGILPEPKQILMRKGKFSLAGTTTVLVDAASEADIFSAGYLSKPVGSLADKWPSFAVMEVKSNASLKGRCVLVGDVSGKLWMQDVLEKRGVRLPQIKLPPQGYVLDIGRDLIVIHGEGASGRFYGVQTLRQLMFQNRKAIPALRIADWPDLDWRGAWHTFTVNESNIDLACLFKMNVGALSFEQKKKYHFRPLSFTAHTWFGHTGGALVPPEKREPLQ